MRKLFALITALCLLLVYPAAGDSPPISGYTLRESSVERIVYATRSLKASIVGYLIPGSGQEITIMSVDGDWCLIRFTAEDGEHSGFVPLSYFDVTPAATASPAPDAAPAYEGGSQAWIANVQSGYRLNLRKEPSATAASLGKYYTGTPLLLTGNESNGFVQVLAAGTTFGWVDARYITLDALGFVPETPTVTLDHPGGAALRTGPGSSYDRAAWLSHGTAITVLGVGSGGWYHVQAGDHVGFIAEDLLSGQFSFDHGMDSDNPTHDASLLTTELFYINTRTTGGQLHLRKSASTSAKSLGLFYTGTPVEVLSQTRSGWAYVRIGQTEGYMDADYLIPTKPTAYGVLRTVRNTRATGLNLRALPSTGGELMGFAPNYTTLTLLGELENNWCYVDLNGALGYMLGTYLK